MQNTDCLAKPVPGNKHMPRAIYLLLIKHRTYPISCCTNTSYFDSAPGRSLTQAKALSGAFIEALAVVSYFGEILVVLSSSPRQWDTVKDLRWHFSTCLLSSSLHEGCASTAAPHCPALTPEQEHSH